MFESDKVIEIKMRKSIRDWFFTRVIQDTFAYYIVRWICNNWNWFFLALMLYLDYLSVIWFGPTSCSCGPNGKEETTYLMPTLGFSLLYGIIFVINAASEVTDDIRWYFNSLDK